MNKKYNVKLNETERKQIHETINNKTTSSTVRKRCNILLLADETAGKPVVQEEIARRCGVSDVTVFTAIKDYCISGISYVLRRKSQSKPPVTPIVNGETEARIVALACGEPPEGFSRWSLRLLTKRIIELNIVESIGRETVRQTLKKLNLNLT